MHVLRNNEYAAYTEINVSTNTDYRGSRCSLDLELLYRAPPYLEDAHMCQSLFSYLCNYFQMRSIYFHIYSITNVITSYLDCTMHNAQTHILSNSKI